MIVTTPYFIFEFKYYTNKVHIWKYCKVVIIHKSLARVTTPIGPYISILTTSTYFQTVVE